MMLQGWDEYQLFSYTGRKMECKHTPNQGITKVDF